MQTGSESRRYQVGAVLGKGGFGTVYRAQLQGSGGFAKQVALKVLNANMEGTTEIVARLRDEARMLGLLRHRAIVQVDGLVKLEGRWAVVMEYVEGVSLKRLVDTQAALPVGPLLEIIEEVASALHTAWAKPLDDGQPLRLLHRDIKPSNIQITPSGDIKLLDFGVARANFDTREAQTRSVVYGSMPYLAPERLEFRESDKSDVFALGVTAFEMLIGELPGQASAHPQRHADRLRAGLERVRAKVDDPAIISLLASMVAYEPDDRPSAGELESKVRDLRRGYSEVFLREWAAQQVPELLRSQPLARDTLSGSVLTEFSGALMSLQGNPDDTFELRPPTDEAVMPPGSAAATFTDDDDDILSPQAASASLSLGSVAVTERAPVVAPPPVDLAPPPVVEAPSRPAPASPPRRSTAGSVFRGLLLTLFVLLLLTGTVVVGGTVLIGGSFTALVALVWDDAMQSSMEDDFTTMLAKLRRVRDNAPKRKTRRLLEKGRSEAYKQRFGLMEMVTFQGKFDDAVRDGVVTDAEYKNLDRAYARAMRR